MVYFHEIFSQNQRLGEFNQLNCVLFVFFFLIFIQFICTTPVVGGLVGQHLT